MIRKLKKAVKGAAKAVRGVAKGVASPVKKVAKVAEKALKSPVGATLAGAGIGKIMGGKAFGAAGKVAGAGLGAVLGRKLASRRRGQATASATEEDDRTDGRSGTAAVFKKGGMVDKTGRAMGKTSADAKGRAMPKKMMGGGMAKYAKGGSVACGPATRGYGAARKSK